MSKAPKKKESKERVTSAYPSSQRHVAEASAAGNIGVIQEEKSKKGRAPLPVWPEWSDQDIASEKWDIGHKVKVDAKGKSPSTASHFYEDPEGKVDLPPSLKDKVHSWKRPMEIIGDGKVPTVVEPESLKERTVDLLTSNPHIAGSEVVRWIVSSVTALTKINQCTENDQAYHHLKVKPSKDMKDSKAEKIKKDVEHMDDAAVWKPWHHIWPKDGSKGHLVPTYNPSGKYCVKLYWMGTWRKVTVDDLIPVDEEGRVLFPASRRDSEIWSLLLSKAIIKVASLDYGGGVSNSEFGDWSVITCLTGWIPEPIPLKNGHKGEIWKLLMSVLPNWKLPVPCPPPVERKAVGIDSKTTSELNVGQKTDVHKVEIKESKDMKDSKTKKEDKEKSKGHEEKKIRDKSTEKGDRDIKGKDKGITLSTMSTKVPTSEPEFVLFASYSSIPKTPLKITTLREMANASETLRLSGLSHNHPHPVLLTTVRNTPLVAPPTPVPVPRWKLIRQKKQRQPVESDPVPAEPIKDPQFVEVFSPFVNYCVSPVPVSRAPSPVKWDKFKPQTPMASVNEENGLGDVNGGDSDNSAEESAETDKSVMQEDKVEKEVFTSDATKGNTQTAEASNASVQSKMPAYNEKKDLQENGDKQGSESGFTDIQSKEKRNSKGMSSASDKALSDVASKSRKSSKAVEAKDLKDAKKSSSKDSVKDSVKMVEQPKTPNAEDDLEEDMPEDGGHIEEQDSKAEDTEVIDEKRKEDTELWIDYEDFTKCFSTLWIFHKPPTYLYQKSHTEIKGVETKAEKGKKGGAVSVAHAATAPTPIGRGAVNISPCLYGSHQPHTEPPPPYLLVDSLSNVEITIGFTSFSKWFDQQPDMFVRSSKIRDKEKEDQENDKEAGKPVPPAPGIIIAEPYSWKSLVAGQPSLRIRTTGVKAAVLSLPPGRHFLRLMVQAPLGYHLDICSQTPFIFGDEDTVMQHLTKESSRFVHQALTTIHELGKVIKMFQDTFTELERNINLGLPYKTKQSRMDHLDAFFSSLSIVIKEEFGETCPPGLGFALEALKLKTLLHLKPTSSEHSLLTHSSESEISSTAVMRLTDERRYSMPEDGSLSQLETEDAKCAATKIQAHFRGFFLRKIIKSFESGSEENKTADDLLHKVWGMLSSNPENSSVKIYRMMFEMHPEMYPLYPFYKDEWTRIAYADYHGSYIEQTSHSWFIVFRDVFYVHKPVLVVPRMYINIPSCVLRVINNDTMEDLPRVFMKVAPKLLQINKNGYTFVAEARSSDAIVPAGKFRLRLIGSSDPLPSPAKEAHVSTNFNTREIRDYYIPNKHNIIMRYTVKVAGDVLTSIQFSTSKSDVYIKLQILDHEKELISVQGKGHAVIPAFTFLKDRTDEDDDARSSRKGSRQNSSKSSPRNSKIGKRPSSSNLHGALKGNKKSEKDLLDTSLQDEQIHKYMIQASVLRESWPLSKGQWNFVAMLKNMEKTDGEATEPVRPEKEKHSAGPKGKKGSKKDADGRASKSVNASSRPGSQNIDSSKPSWVLRVVTDVNSSEMDIKRDTERQDQIKAMKAAWEAAEPGRAAKAQQIRMKFLSENTVNVEKVKSVDEEEIDADALAANAPTEPALLSPTSPGPSEVDASELTLEPPPKEKDTILKPFDISPYIRTVGRTVLLDESEEERIHAEHESQQRKFLAIREEVLKRREEDLNQRNTEKEMQIQLYEDMQAKLDLVRDLQKGLRDKYCQKYLEQPPEPAPQETEHEKKRKTPSPTRGRKSPKGKSSKSPGKGKKK